MLEQKLFDLKQIRSGLDECYGKHVGMRLEPCIFYRITLGSVQLNSFNVNNRNRDRKTERRKPNSSLRWAPYGYDMVLSNICRLMYKKKLQPTQTSVKKPNES